MSCLCVGEALPRAAAKIFSSIRKINLSDFQSGATFEKYDVVILMNLLGDLDKDFSKILEELSSVLHEESTLILYEPAKKIQTMRIDIAISELLPRVHVSTVSLVDKVSGDVGVVAVLQSLRDNSKPLSGSEIQRA